MPANIIPLRPKPGIKRDGTVFEGDFYVDGRWVRFQRGLPRKIKGYKSTGQYFPQPCRGLHVFTEDNLVYVHGGTSSYVNRIVLDDKGLPSLVVDRTPASGFSANSQNTWTFDVMYSSVSTNNRIIAHVAADLDEITSSANGAIFTGDVTATAALTPVTVPSNANAAGGIVVLHPYLFYYGADGVAGWSVAGNPADLSGTGSGQARIASDKIIKGMPLRAGAGNAPAGIFWSYSSVIRGTFTGGTTVFQFDTLSVESSIISKNCPVEYDGVYYWVGVDRFLMFNGVVREVPNEMNLNWFFDNINFDAREKVFGFKVPRFGEIWWCFPFGNATECTHAVIFNVREGTWYDTELPTDYRTASIFSNLLTSPLMTSMSGELFRHEYGVDGVDELNIEAIQSYFETSDLSLAVLNNQNRKMRISMIEPDFVQVGDMSVYVTGRANARAPDVVGNRVIFPDNALNEPSKQVVVMKEQRRELRVKFESNVVGGDYQMGQVLIHIEPGDGTIMGA